MVCVDESHGISGSFESIDLLVWVSNQHLGTLLCLDDTDDGCTGREGERGERLEGHTVAGRLMDVPRCSEIAFTGHSRGQTATETRQRRLLKAVDGC